MRAVIYARASQRNFVLQINVERAETYAKLAGYEIVEVITEVGLGSFDARQGIQRLYMLIADGKLDVIVAESQETFSGFNPGITGKTDLALFIAHLARNGVRLDLIG